MTMMILNVIRIYRQGVWFLERWKLSRVRSLDHCVKNICVVSGQWLGLMFAAVVPPYIDTSTDNPSLLVGQA